MIFKNAISSIFLRSSITVYQCLYSSDLQGIPLSSCVQLGYLLAIPQPQEVINNEDFEIEGLDFVVSGQLYACKLALSGHLDSLSYCGLYL